MRFLADMGVSPKIVEWLRGKGHDATHLRDEGLQQMPDEKIFAKAHEENRVILTFDLDFGEIASLSGGTQTSVIVFRLRDTRTSHVIERLAKVLAESEAALRLGAVIVVEEARHRVRRLPVGEGGNDV